jgi:hypothetical protein
MIENKSGYDISELSMVAATEVDAYLRGEADADLGIVGDFIRELKRSAEREKERELPGEGSDNEGGVLNTWIGPLERNALCSTFSIHSGEAGETIQDILTRHSALLGKFENTLTSGRDPATLAEVRSYCNTFFSELAKAAAESQIDAVDDFGE